MSDCFQQGSLFVLMAGFCVGVGTDRCGAQIPVLNSTAVTTSPVSFGNGDGDAKDDLDSCRVHRVTGLPGSHQFASDFIETIASDPDPDAEDPAMFIWGLTGGCSERVLAGIELCTYRNRPMVGRHGLRLREWIRDILMRASLRVCVTDWIVAPGGDYFVITTQRGAFQVFVGRVRLRLW